MKTHYLYKQIQTFISKEHIVQSTKRQSTKTNNNHKLESNRLCQQNEWEEGNGKKKIERRELYIIQYLQLTTPYFFWKKGKDCFGKPGRGADDGSGWAATYAKALAMASGIGGGVGKCAPLARKPFSSAMYDTEIGIPSGEV